jgi:hypothetical protein
MVSMDRNSFSELTGGGSMHGEAITPPLVRDTVTGVHGPGNEPLGTKFSIGMGFQSSCSWPSKETSPLRSPQGILVFPFRVQ